MLILQLIILIAKYEFEVNKIVTKINKRSKKVINQLIGICGICVNAALQNKALNASTYASS